MCIFKFNVDIALDSTKFMYSV